MEGDGQQQDLTASTASTDPKNKATKTTPTLQEQFDALVNQKNDLWDSKGNYPDPYDDSFKQTDVYRKIEDIDKELFKIEGQMKGAV